MTSIQDKVAWHLGAPPWEEADFSGGIRCNRHQGSHYCESDSVAHATVGHEEVFGSCHSDNDTLCISLARAIKSFLQLQEQHFRTGSLQVYGHTDVMQQHACGSCNAK